jgi:hypothetical protein
MSQKITEIRFKAASGWVGLAENGVLSASEMISKIREYSADLREKADAIDAVPDDQFTVESFTGQYARKNKKVIQSASLNEKS